MDISNWVEEIKQLHLQGEARVRKRARIAMFGLIRRTIILFAVIAIAIWSYLNEAYLTSNLLHIDLKSFFLRCFNDSISDVLADICDLAITVACAVCMLYTMYWFGFFHLLGSGNSNYRGSKYPNIERTVKYIDGIVGAKSNDDAADILTGKKSIK